MEEVSEAEVEVIRSCQKKRFPGEFYSHQNGLNVKPISHMYKLNPVNEDWSFESRRTVYAAMPDESKHSVILAKYLHISNITLRPQL